MKSPVFNPFLPACEYIPDGEPRLFGDRVYLYGSHDRFNGALFCLNDYVCYSAPADDLSAWRYEGLIYRKRQDPRNKAGLRLLFAPDVVLGPDMRYYLYYTLDFSGLMGVAVSSTPTGPFSFHGHIRRSDGSVWGRRRGDQLPFDPGVLVDKGRVFLYSGFALNIPAPVTGFVPLKSDGGVVLELEPDMVTIKREPRLLFPRKGPGSFPGHEFFEASSIRKIKGLYYFVYSSCRNHELCYAVSDKPDADFRFAGTLVSQGDVGLAGINGEHEARNYLGNTHGGLLSLKGKLYVFYHRQTNRHSYSRQACAEELPLDDRGEPVQAEVTSCGLNGGALPGQGRYGAYMACRLYSQKGAGRYDRPLPRLRYRKHPFITQEGRDGQPGAFQYIANMRHGSVAAFKYFEFDGTTAMGVEVRGRAKGTITVSSSERGESLAEIPIHVNHRRARAEVLRPFRAPEGVSALYFRYAGKGKLDFLSFSLFQEADS